MEIRLKLIRPAFVALVTSAIMAGCTGMGTGLSKPAKYERVPAEIIPLTLEYLVEQQKQIAAGLGDALAFRDDPVFADYSSSIYDYRIGAGDILDITVPTFASLVTPSAGGNTGAGGLPAIQDAGYVVSRAGYISVPYVGEMAVEGLTLTEARNNLVAALSKYIRSPQVSLTVREFRSQKVLISGQVDVPGFVPVTDIPLTVFGVLSKAGSVQATAAADTVFADGQGQGGAQSLPALEPDLSRVALKRSGATTFIDVMAMQESQDFSRDFVLQDGDILHVPPLERAQVFALGEFARQGTLRIVNNQSTLAQALLAAGGFDKESVDTSEIYVLRGDLDRPTVFHLNMAKVDSMLLADAFQLRDHDVIYASEAGISKWNRFLNQIFPTLQRLIFGAVAAGA